MTKGINSMAIITVAFLINAFTTKSGALSRYPEIRTVMPCKRFFAKNAISSDRRGKVRSEGLHRIP
jgi:hypothetical protein